MKIKVLHLIKSLNLGGAEKNLFNLANSFDKDKIEVHVGYSYGGDFECPFKKSGIIFYKYSKGLHKVFSFRSFLIIFA